MIPKTFSYSQLPYSSYFSQYTGNLRVDDNGYLYGFIGPGHYNYESRFRIVKYNPVDYSEIYSQEIQSTNLYGLYTLVYSTYNGSSNYYFDRLTYDKDNNYLLTGMDNYYGNYEYLVLVDKDNGTYTRYNFRTHPSLTAFRTKYTTTGNLHLSSMLQNPHRKYQDTADNGFRFAFTQQNSTVGQTSRVIIGKLYIDSIHTSYGIDFNLSSGYQVTSLTLPFQTKDKDNRFYFFTQSKGSTTKKFYLNRVSETQLEENILEAFDYSISTYNYNYINDMYYDEYSNCLYMTFSYYEMSNPSTGTEYSVRLVKFNCGTKTVEKSQNVYVPGGNINYNNGKLHVDLKNRLFFGFCNGSGKVDSNESSISKFYTINMDTFDVKIKRFFNILNEQYPTDRPLYVYLTSGTRCITHKDKFLFYGNGYYYSGPSTINTYWMMTQTMESMLVQDPEKVQKITAFRQPGYLSNNTNTALMKNEKNGYIYRFLNGSGGTPGPKTLQKIDPTTLKVVKTNTYPTATYGQFYWQSDTTSNNIIEDKNGNYVFFYGSGNPAYKIMVINKDDLSATIISPTLYSGNWLWKPYGSEFYHTLSDNSYNCVGTYSSSYEPGIRTIYFYKFFPYDLTKVNKITPKQLSLSYPFSESVSRTCFDGVSKIYFVTYGKIASPAIDYKKRYLNSYDILTDTVEEKIYTIFESETETVTINDMYYDNETNSIYISWHTDAMNGSYVDKRKVRYVKFNAITKTETLSKDISVPGAGCPTKIVPNGDRRFKSYVNYNSYYTPTYMQKERFVSIDMDTFDTVERPYLGQTWSGGFTPSVSTRNNSFTIGNYDYFEGSVRYTLTDPLNGYSIIAIDRRTLMPGYVNNYNEFLYYDNVYFDKSTNTNLTEWTNWDFQSHYNGFCGKSISANILSDRYYIDTNDGNTLHREVIGTAHISGLFHTNEKIIIPDGSRNTLLRVSSCDIGVYDPNGDPLSELTGTNPAEYLNFEYTVSGRVGLENFTRIDVRTNSAVLYNWSSDWGELDPAETFLQKESFYIGNRNTSQSMINNNNNSGYMYDGYAFPNIKYGLQSYSDWTYIGYFGSYLQSQMDLNTTFKVELTLDVFGQNIIYYTGNGGYAAINYTYNGITNYQFANFIGRPLINTFYIPGNRVIV